MNLAPGRRCSWFPLEEVSANQKASCSNPLRRPGSPVHLSFVHSLKHTFHRLDFSSILIRFFSTVRRNVRCPCAEIDKAYCRGTRPSRQAFTVCIGKQPIVYFCSATRNGNLWSRRNPRKRTSTVLSVFYPSPFKEKRGRLPGLVFLRHVAPCTFGERQAGSLRASRPAHPPPNRPTGIQEHADTHLDFSPILR